MSILDVLERLSVLNRDDGFRFTNTERLDAIAFLLRGSSYSKVETNGLFHLYSSKPVETIKEPVILIMRYARKMKLAFIVSIINSVSIIVLDGAVALSDQYGSPSPIIEGSRDIFYDSSI